MNLRNAIILLTSLLIACCTMVC